jgi:RNA polymerase sigma factor for flagellar operon FliA
VNRYFSGTKIVTGVASYRDLNDGDEDLFETAEFGHVMQAALNGLQLRDELVLRLYYFEGLSFREISERLTLSYPCVVKVHQRALRRLRPALSPIYAD